MLDKKTWGYLVVGQQRWVRGRRLQDVFNGWLLVKLVVSRDCFAHSSVVYLDQRMLDSDAVCWRKSSFSAFYHLSPSQMGKQEKSAIGMTAQTIQPPWPDYENSKL